MLMADLIRGKSVVEAERILGFKTNKTAEPMLKLLLSAKANARHNFNLDPETLYVSKLCVDKGPVLKRSMPRSRGTAFPIMKFTSHVHIELGSKEDISKPPTGLRGIREAKALKVEEATVKEVKKPAAKKVKKESKK
jgi:large subunit ribosomal protein L22